MDDWVPIWKEIVVAVKPLYFSKNKKRHDREGYVSLLKNIKMMVGFAALELGKRLALYNIQRFIQGMGEDNEPSS